MIIKRLYDSDIVSKTNSIIYESENYLYGYSVVQHKRNVCGKPWFVDIHTMHIRNIRGFSGNTCFNFYRTHYTHCGEFDIF